MSSSVLVVGAGSGIGLELTKLLLNSENFHVIGAGRKVERLSECASHPRFQSLQIDVCDEQSVQEGFESIKSQDIKLSAIVNCAGSVILKPAHLTSLADFNSTIAVNLTSCFLLLKYGVPVLGSTGGSFLFFSTAATGAHLANHDAIAAAKGGVEGLTRAAAATYASKNIRVNAIAPGLTKTPLTERIHGNPSAAQASTSMHALGRLGEPSEIASLACWMLSPGATWMTGQVIAFDGGLGLKNK